MLGMVWTADGFGSDCVGLDLTMDWFGDSSILDLIDSSRYLMGANRYLLEFTRIY